MDEYWLVGSSREWAMNERENNILHDHNARPHPAHASRLRDVSNSPFPLHHLSSFKVLHNAQPSYLSDIINLHRPQRLLISCDQNLLRCSCFSLSLSLSLSLPPSPFSLSLSLSLSLPLSLSLSLSLLSLSSLSPLSLSLPL